MPPNDEGIGDDDWGEDSAEFGEDDTGDTDTGELPDIGDPTNCAPIVDSLVITDATTPESVACVEQVLGDLTVGPTTELFNLELLTSLREVGGAFNIVGNLALTSVEGVEHLEQVGWLHVRRNRNLSDLHGLSGLTAVERLTVTDNAGMTSLAGLSDGLAPSVLEVADNELLASLDGLPHFIAPGSGQPLKVEIEDNPKLIDLGGLSDCCAAQALALTLDRNPVLTDLGGLEAFARLDALRLHDNPSLASLDGLDELIEVRVLHIEYDHCVPSNQASLTALGGAPNLAEIDVLNIHWVDSLTSLAGLEGVYDLDQLSVRNNEVLPWDAVLELADQTGPLVLDACGGLGGPACTNDPCPMF